MADTGSRVSPTHPVVRCAFDRLENFYNDRKDLKALIRAKPPESATAWIPELVRQIIEHNAIQQHVRLHNLPHEIMVEITENLSWPDNVSLSLTCKGLANKTQVARKHFDKVEKAEKLTRDAKRATRVARNLRRNANASPRAPRKSYARPVRRNTKSACNANESLKAPTKFVRLDLLRQIHDFFPATRYSLCYRCIKYVPRNFGSVAWGGHDQYKNRVFDSKIAHELGPRCHRCVERQRLEIFATETQMQQLKKQIARI